MTVKFKRQGMEKAEVEAWCSKEGQAKRVIDELKKSVSKVRRGVIHR